MARKEYKVCNNKANNSPWKNVPSLFSCKAKSKNLENKTHTQRAKNVLHFASKIEANGAAIHVQAISAKVREHANCFEVARIVRGLRKRAP